MNEHIRKHHRVCLGLLAQIYHNDLSERSQKIAIEQAICIAEGLD